MNDQELDQVLNRWKTPAPSAALRGRVLDRFPRRKRLGFGRPLLWAAAMAVLLAMLAVGMEQVSQGSLENLSREAHVYSQRTKRWFEQMWLAHMVHAFRNSELKVYVDGELRNDVVIGGSSGGLTVKVPGEGKYFLAFHLDGFKGAYTPGRFGGHTLEFDAGGRAVRIESSGSFGFGDPRPVYMLGPARNQ